MSEEASEEERFVILQGPEGMTEEEYGRLAEAVEATLPEDMRALITRGDVDTLSRGEILRTAAGLVETVAEDAPEWDGDEETLAEYEAEFGEVPSYRSVLLDITNSIRQLALMMDVEGRKEHRLAGAEPAEQPAEPPWEDEDEA